MTYVHLLNPKKTKAESSELVFIMNIINTDRCKLIFVHRVVFAYHISKD